jgi:hypothetical protein
VTRRQNNCVLWLVSFALIVCLAGLELPELLTLTNDTSNDFTTFLHSSEKSAAPVQLRVADLHAAKRSLAPRHIYGFCHQLFATIDTPARLSARDLLVLHSFWRT